MSTSPPAALLLLAAILVPLLAAILAASGFRGRDELLGLDLGTTYSAVSIRSGAGRGNVTVARHGGRLTTPSVVAVGPRGELIAGTGAEAVLRGAPARGVVDAKRVIGRFVEDAMVAAEAPRHAGRLLEHPSARRGRVTGRSATTSKTTRAACAADATACAPDLAFAIPLAGLDSSARSAAARDACIDEGSLVDARSPPTGWPRAGDLSALSVTFSTPYFLMLTPQAASCVIARGLRNAAAATLGHKQAQKVMAATPADFSAAQRYATTEALERAGLRVVRLLHEPTAAALAYGLHQNPEVHTVVVFDMGGGTLDVSVLFAAENSFTVYATAGDNALGGEDVDDCIAQLLRQDSRVDETGCPEHRRSAEAERVKIALSGDGGAGSIPTVAWSCGRLSGELTAAVFEDACGPLLDRTMVPVREALERASVAPDDVDEVVLVGGSSRLPWVRARLATLFKKAPRSSVDPDLAVAIGAAAAGD